MKDIGIGVIGLGRLGYVHAFNASQLPKAKLVAVCDIAAGLAKETAQELGCAYYTDLNRMLEDKAVDAVCVATPTAVHVEPVTAVVRSGKPLFCEKPLASTMEDTEKLARIIQESRIKCQIGFHRRFDPDHAEAEQMVREGVIGKPVFINAFSRDPLPPPPWACDPSKGGGLYIDFLLHDFDMARFIMRDEVDTVYADETNLVIDSKGIERFADNATVNLRFRGGALANYHASMHAGYGYDIRTEVFGSEGNLMIGSLHRTAVTLCTSNHGISNPQTFQTKGRVPHFMVRFREAYRLEMASFVDCILNDCAPKVTEVDAMAAFKIAVAAGRSAGKHCPVAVEGW
jgi:scyllo-inositol 2-dehydrogenase (NAD+)